MDSPIVTAFIAIKFTQHASQTVNLVVQVDSSVWRLMDSLFMVPLTMMARSSDRKCYYVVAVQIDYRCFVNTIYQIAVSGIQCS